MSKEGMENKEGKKENDAKKTDDKDADDKDDASNADKVPKKEGFDDNKKTIPKMNDKTDKSKDEPVGAEAQKTKGTNGKNFVSQGDTLAEAYKNLEGMIGKDGIKGLTNQTETLLNQQHELMQNIKGMEPFIATAENLMSKLDLSSLDGIGSMLSNLGGKKE